MIIIGILIDSVPWIVNGLGIFKSIVYTALSVMKEKMIVYTTYKLLIFGILFAISSKFQLRKARPIILLVTISLAVCFAIFFYKGSINDAKYILEQTQGEGDLKRAYKVFHFEPNLLSLLIVCVIASFWDYRFLRTN